MIECPSSWVFALCLLSACEKTPPFELTVAAPATPVVTSGRPLDAGLRLLDAQSPVAVSDGALGQETPAQAFSKAALLQALADCALERLREFDARASALQAATAAWAASPTDALRLAAQAAWYEAMASWQVSELFRFGPIGPASEPGGKDYRNAVYFFPDINLCLVDQQLVSRRYEEPPLGLDVSTKGLGALEYLLFYAGAANSCSSVVTINSGMPSPWLQLDAAELNARRAGYAAILGAALASTAKVMLAAWAPASGNFWTQFSAAGTSASSTYPTQQDAFNVLDNAMFYVDKELKDFKIALPAGLSIDCTEGTCPQKVESRFAQAANANIVENLRGFRLLYQGCGVNHSGLGFDDYLIAVGKPDLASRLLAATDKAQQAAAALPLPLEQLLSTDLSQVLSLHASIKAISDLLKTEFVSALNLELPAMAQGDND